jgi:hypothetical protein
MLWAAAWENGQEKEELGWEEKGSRERKEEGQGRISTCRK